MDRWWLRIENISFSYTKGKPIINTLSAVIGTWKKVLFAWPSWSGKTTLLYLLWWVLCPTEWKIFYDNTLITPEIRTEKFGYSLVENYFFESLSVKENITTFTEFNGIAYSNDWYEYLLHSFEMKNLEYALMRELSAWQRERVSLMRALIHSPNVLLLDEPGSHLDKALAIKLQTFLWEYQKTHNATLIISSHWWFEETLFDQYFDFYEDFTISIRTNPNT